MEAFLKKAKPAQKQEQIQTAAGQTKVPEKPKYVPWVEK
jgi:hypothetical protein